MARSFAYASTVDVLAHLPLAATFTATSKPSATQVHLHLLTASDELDGALSQADYTTPIATTATGAMELLRTYAAIGAGMYAADSHPAGKDSKQLPFLERRWDAILSGVRDGSLTLADAGRDTTRSLPRFGTPSDPEAAGASPYFIRDLTGRV